MKLISDEEIKQACRDEAVWYPIISTADRNIAQAQLVADREWLSQRLSPYYLEGNKKPAGFDLDLTPEEYQQLKGNKQ